MLLRKSLPISAFLIKPKLWSHFAFLIKPKLCNTLRGKTLHTLSLRLEIRANLLRRWPDGLCSLGGLLLGPFPNTSPSHCHLNVLISMNSLFSKNCVITILSLSICIDCSIFSYLFIYKFTKFWCYRGITNAFRLFWFYLRELWVWIVIVISNSAILKIKCFFFFFVLVISMFITFLGFL